ncbi:MAG: hypothetical protein AABY22_02960 [Nanoarchaeota archaeon]
MTNYEQNWVEVKHKCGKCYQPTDSRYSYIIGTITEKKVREIAKKLLCKKCKGDK